MEERGKIILKGDEALEAIKAGVRQVADVVKTTLGPNGRNSLVSRDWRMPDITNDGVTIARNIILEDEAENEVAQSFIDVAKRTNEEAGDGTTTSIVLAYAMLEEGWKELDGGAFAKNTNVMDVKRQLQKDKEHVLKELKKVTKKSNTLNDLKLVANASMEDEEIGNTIAEIVHKIGKDGFISTEEGYTQSIESEIINGMKFHGTYGAEFMATNDRKQAVYEKIDVLLTNYELASALPLQTLVARLQQNGKNGLVIFAKKFSASVLVEIAKAKRQNFHILAVKIPSLLTDEHEDISVFTGAKFFDGNAGISLEQATPDDLGHVDKIAVDDTDTILIGGAGTEEEIKDHIIKLRTNQSMEEVEMLRKKIDRRIASMTSGVGVIKVGARSDAERLYLKRKVEDAVYATQAALEEGVVSGGGKTLNDIGKAMDDGILARAIQEPYNQIQLNAGGNLVIPDTIKDPVKVTRTALENAVSIASMLLTTETLVIEKRTRTEYEGLSEIAKQLKNE